MPLELDPGLDLVCLGGEVKALDERDGELKVGGYVVLFGDPSVADLSTTRDYFTKATDYGFDVAARGRVRWHHGLDPKVGRAVLGLVDFKAEPDDVGVWAEGWIKARAEYEKRVARWVKEKKAGWSTGVPAHCVGRKAVGDAHEITEWPLGADVSITLTPADPRQVGRVLALKSFLDGPGSALEVKDRPAGKHGHGYPKHKGKIEGHWITAEGRHIFIMGPAHGGPGKGGGGQGPSPKEQAAAKRARKGSDYETRARNIDNVYGMRIHNAGKPTDPKKKARLKRLKAKRAAFLERSGLAVGGKRVPFGQVVRPTRSTKSVTVDDAAPASPSFVEDCLKAASDLRASAAKFAKLGPAKRGAIEELRDALDELIRPRETAPDFAKARLQIEGLMSRLNRG
jgi:hypothetical protein